MWALFSHCGLFRLRNYLGFKLYVRYQFFLPNYNNSYKHIQITIMLFLYTSSFIAVCISHTTSIQSFQLYFLSFSYFESLSFSSYNSQGNNLFLPPLHPHLPSAGAVTAEEGVCQPKRQNLVRQKPWLPPGECPSLSSCLWAVLMTRCWSRDCWPGSGEGELNSSSWGSVDSA